MRLESLLRMAGENWEILRDGLVVGTAGGIRDTKKEKVDFVPNTDVKEGDVITGSVCKKTYQVKRTDVVTADGRIFCIEAYYGEPISGGGRGHTVHIGTAVGSPLMFDSPAATQKVHVTFTAESADDLKVIIRGLLGALDELGLPDSDKESVKEDAEYLKKKVDGGKAEPGLVRECLNGIKKRLADAAATAASSKITTKAGHYLGLITDFITNTLEG